VTFCAWGCLLLPAAAAAAWWGGSRWERRRNARCDGQAIKGELERLKDEFLSHVSHEFRSPLASLIGYVDLMIRQKDAPGARQQDYLTTMRASAERLKKFVDNVIDMSRLDAGLMPLSTEPQDVRELLEAAAQLARREADPYSISLRVECPGSFYVQADRDQLLKAMGLMISNAVHFTPDGGHVTLWAKQEGKKSVLMGVTDSGIGIAKDKFERIFEKFERGGAVQERPRKNYGAGLGLCLTRRLLKAQSGSVWVEQSSPKGTTIAWRLPACALQSPSQASPAPASSSKRSAPPRLAA